MKRLFVVAVLLIAASFPALAQTTKGDYKNINVVDTLEAAGNFTTLLAALRQTGLIDTLKGPGPFTLFAPNDAAFAKLPPETMDALMKNPAELRSLLLYHVTAGKLSIKDLQSKTDKSITTMENRKAWFQCDEIGASSPKAKLLCNEDPKAKITCNGMKPAGSQSKAKLQCDESPQSKAKLQCNENPKAQITCNGMKPAGPQSKAKLLCDEISAAPIIINKSARVVMADLGASNGMIHVIDAVLMPPTP